jgi:AcrR family transcriptional regulator
VVTVSRRSLTQPQTKGANPAVPANRRQRRSTEFRERIFRAALDLFADKGFAKTTVEDITNAADIGKGTFFNYFPSKDHILIAFSEMQIAKLEMAVQSARHSSQPMPEFMRELSVKMTTEPARSPSVVRAILLGNLSSPLVRSAMRKNHAYSQKLLTSLVKSGQARGEFRKDFPAAELAQVFRQTVFGTLLIWSVYEDSSLPARINTAMQVLLTGLAPRHAADPLSHRGERKEKRS